MFRSLVGLLVVLCLGVSGCMERAATFHFSEPVRTPLSLTRDTVSRIRLTEYDVARYDTVEQAMWAEGTRSGMRAVFNDFLQLEPVFRPVDSPGRCVGAGEPVRQGPLMAQADPVTHDYVQKFRVSARFSPTRSCSGRILALEEDRFLAGSGDRFTAVMYGGVSEDHAGYFLVARQVQEEGGRLLQVVGSGRIVRSLGPAGFGTGSDGQEPGTLCQAELWETNREVEQGDLLFILDTSVKALPRSGPTVQPSETGYPEVVVEPRQEPVFDEPAEDK